MSVQVDIRVLSWGRPGVRHKIQRGVIVEGPPITQADYNQMKANYENRAPTREEEIDQAIASDVTLAQLKTMTNAEFSSWWDANITDATKAIAVLERLALVVIRRVL